MNINFTFLSIIFFVNNYRYSVKATREQICHILHHHYFQIVVCVLVLLDTAVVVTEIMVETSNSNSESKRCFVERFEIKENVI